MLIVSLRLPRPETLRLHVTPAHLQIPVAAKRRRSGQVIGGRHVRIGQVGDEIEQGLARLARAQIAAVQEEVAVFGQRLPDPRHVRLHQGNRQAGGDEGIPAEMQSTLGAVAENVDGVVTGVGLGPLRQLGQAALGAIDQHDPDAVPHPVHQGLIIGQGGVDEDHLPASAIGRRVGGAELNRGCDGVPVGSRRLLIPGVACLAGLEVAEPGDCGGFPRLIGETVRGGGGQCHVGGAVEHDPGFQRPEHRGGRRQETSFVIAVLIHCGSPVGRLSRRVQPDRPRGEGQQTHNCPPYLIPHGSSSIIEPRKPLPGAPSGRPGRSGWNPGKSARRMTFEFRYQLNFL